MLGTERRKVLFQEIEDERNKQDAKWGGPTNDELHSSWDWIAFITKHTGKAVMWPWDGPLFRYQMVRVAALAVAAIEWFDRRPTNAGNGN